MTVNRFGPWQVETQSGRPLAAGTPVLIRNNVAGASVASVVFGAGNGGAGHVASGGFTGFVVGATVSGTGVPAEAIISSISGNNIVLAKSDGEPLGVDVTPGTITLTTADSPDSAATIFTDDAGSVPPAVAGTVTTDDNGNITFVAATGDYWISAPGGEAGPTKIEVIAPGSTLTAGDVESMFTAGGQIFAGTGVGTGGLRAIPWSFSKDLQAGNCSVANNVKPPGVAAPANLNVTAVTVRVGTAPTGTNGVTVRVNKNGVSQGTINIPAAASSGSIWTTTGHALPFPMAAGDVLTFDVTTVGGTITGADLAIDVVGGYSA